MLKLTENIKTILRNAWTEHYSDKPFYDWWFMEIDFHANEKKVSNEKELKALFNDLLEGSEKEPNFHSFIEMILNLHF